MKQIVQVTEVDGEGFEALMGKRVTLFCGNYIYTGELVGVNAEFVKLAKAAIVYETGALNTKTWQDAQEMPNDVYIMKGFVESFTILK